MSARSIGYSGVMFELATCLASLVRKILLRERWCDARVCLTTAEPLSNAARERDSGPDGPDEILWDSRLPGALYYESQAAYLYPRKNPK
jgi:hypothetical protein